MMYPNFEISSGANDRGTGENATFVGKKWEKNCWGKKHIPQSSPPPAGARLASQRGLCGLPSPTLPYVLRSDPALLLPPVSLLHSSPPRLHKGVKSWLIAVGPNLLNMIESYSEFNQYVCGNSSISLRIIWVKTSESSESNKNSNHDICDSSPISLCIIWVKSDQFSQTVISRSSCSTVNSSCQSMNPVCLIPCECTC